MSCSPLPTHRHGTWVITANPATLSFTEEVRDAKEIHLLGYRIFNAPMGAGAPLYPILYVQPKNQALRVPSQVSTEGMSNAFPLICDGATTVARLPHPLLLAEFSDPKQPLRKIELQITNNQSSTTTPLGQPLFSHIVLHVRYVTETELREPRMPYSSTIATIFPY